MKSDTSEDGEEVDVKHELTSTGPMQTTDEQLHIIKFGKSLRINEPKIIRVYSGAGTGKRSTLHFLGDALLKAAHSVLYLVYNKVYLCHPGCTDGSDTEIRGMQCNLQNCTTNLYRYMQLHFPILIILDST
jgi:hypothetical protein